MNNNLSIFGLGVIGSLTVASATANTALDLTPMLQDRFEKNCAVRDEYDLHDKNQEIQSILKKYIIKEEFEEQQAYATTVFTLKNTTYSGLVVKKIEFAWGRSHTLSEILYFDLSTPSAKQQFHKIGWNKKQIVADAGLVITKQGKLTTVQCYWPEKNTAE
ncbi:hypothetical protein KTI63_00285 [Acinetobacter guillouiae]|uniref:hypothetical protein n=1 Tax=Acinetobacter guillouiae TaxID=106649 RepID=UPI00125EB524|nr:hypothetical protein [Acinetobacter guillouiae]MCU4490899.1 hypothetical protein [Acinetobacter guillouiae]